MAKTLSEVDFERVRVEHEAAKAFAARFGLGLADRERLSGLSDDELLLRADELAVERDAARACREFVPVHQQQSRQLAVLDGLVASPPGPLSRVAPSVSDADLPGQLVESAVRFVAARNEAWLLAARAELSQPGPGGFDPMVSVGDYRTAETVADRERQVCKRELDARAAERARSERSGT